MRPRRGNVAVLAADLEHVLATIAPDDATPRQLLVAAFALGGRAVLDQLHGMAKSRAFTKADILIQCEDLRLQLDRWRR